MNKGVVACSVLAEPHWRPYQMSRRGDMAVCEGSAEKAKGSMASFDFGLADESRPNVTDNEELLIESLSEFGSGDVAAPIESEYGSPLQQNSDIKSDCTTAGTNASSSASDHLFQHSESVVNAALLGYEAQESPICLPDQDDTGFEWLGSLGDDSLIYTAASNLDMDSFLLSTAMPFSGTFDGVLKHSDYENAILSEQDMGMRQNFTRATCVMSPECRRVDNEKCSRIDCHVTGLQTCNAADSAPPILMTSKSARSKRTRTISGWSSGGFLCERWPENSPTRSLQSSTSQASNEFAKCASQCEGCTTGFMCSQEEGYTPSSHDINMAIKLDTHIIDKSDGDAAKKLGSNEPYFVREDSAKGEALSNSYGGGTLQPRRCTHCLSHKTPQWRAGPMGPKTLCNACGVRFKSGRLFDEYRPAKSPTFLSCKHSNSHKKVMEMRRRKAFHYNQHQRPQHMPLQHRVRASPMLQTDANNQAMLGNFKVKLNAPVPRSHLEVAPTTLFSDVTLIRARNALESPSNCL